MSLQSNLHDVKASFDSDKKILESAFTLEILYKRYRKYIIAGIVCVAIVGVWWSVNAYIHSQRAKEASTAYAKLFENATDTQALQALQKASPELYDMYVYFNAHDGDIHLYEGLADSKNALVRSLAQYEIASIRASESLQDSGLSLDESLAFLERTRAGSLKEFALLQEAYLLFKAKKNDEAYQKLMLIPENSVFYEAALNLRHFGLELQTPKKDKS
ncbi:hypothetical protein [Helicobacter marmotae]|uniref:Tetratricopeptide repeat-like domain-containing protein n=1 Tax=Helicobacter marmotae TaxID=152490 RepID=A0A3D8I7L7_9HELI|nr:hypothetical protein [Helicobacter marmotae]RDU60521.1 hypothetical protein CQA63_02940 [Helicobacter marmotae]